MSGEPHGFDRLRDPSLNKSTAFTEAERDRYGLRGLLPAAVNTQAGQMDRILENLRRKEHDIERYIFLSALQGRNERLFYRALIEHVEELMPLVYTPTVGQACREFAHIFRQSRGFYVTPEDRGRIRQNLDNWPEPDVRVVVVTDGERILGLGDLGANGMGIPIGKLALYTACAGIDPKHCLPVMFDVGTENTSLLEDPLYLGRPTRRLRGKPYLDLMEEFVTAVQDAYPKALIQFEDFLTPTAYDLLERYRHRVLSFNDDIQGTAAVALGGVLAACRITGKPFRDLTLMFLGAGSAATGIADLMTAALIRHGLPEAAARRRVWLVDSQGLVVSGRGELAPHKRPYAHAHAPLGFMEALDAIGPDVLIGATGQSGSFTEGAVRRLARRHQQPIIFALSNPTSQAECTAQQAWEWSEGRAVFASGSPFPPVVLPDGGLWRPGQGNNAYVFPGIGLGIVAVESTGVTEEMFIAAAEALANEVGAADLAEGSVYPRLTRIRAVSLAIATAVAEVAYRQGVAQLPRPADLPNYLASRMFNPEY